MRYEYTIPLPPVTKKNSQRIVVNKTTGRPFIMPSEHFRKWLSMAGWYLRGKPEIKRPVNVKCLFYMPTRRQVDLTNLLEAIDDALVYYGIIADDNSGVVAGHDGSRVRYDKTAPRTEIYIDDMEEDETGC